MKFFYQVSLRLVYFFIPVLGIFFPKLKKWYVGRKQPFPHIDRNQPIIWMHTPSYGEFEQGTPVIKALKEKYPNHALLVTFFSPSGYEGKHNHTLIDYAVYLPFDFPKNVKKFLDYFDPKVALFVKYDFWMNLLNETNARKIPVIYFSSIFRPTQYFFRFPKSWLMRQLKKVDHFFVQNKESQDLLETYGFTGVHTIGDTRIDQVIENSKEPFENSFISKFVNNASKPIVVIGSSWKEDIEIWSEYLKSGKYQFIIAPHEISESNLSDIENKLPNSTRISNPNFDSQNLIVDQLGILKYLYEYGKIAYIGGGFGKGIHNTLEASVYGKPVIFGPKHQKFQEAKDLIELGVGFSINDSKELPNVLSSLNDHKMNEIKELTQSYFSQKAGATKIIMKTLERYL